MKYNLYEVNIQWLDTKDNDTVLFSDGDQQDNDDNVFFYISSEKEFENLKQKGVNDFIVIDYHKLKN